MSVPFLSVNQIINRALLLIRNNENFKNPRVVDSQGNPIFINKLRNFDGFDGNTNGLTLSIYPYSYQGTSNETVNSHNAALVYNDFELGTMIPNNPARERCKLSLVVSITTLGFQNTTIDSAEPASTDVVFEYSEKESALYEWVTDIWNILLTNPISNLGGLVSGSKVNWAGFHSTAWDKKDHAVIHKATLLWHLDLYTVRNYQQFINVINVPNVGPQLTWEYVGVRRSDETPVYWDSNADRLTSVNGFPLLVTPKGKKVTWNPTTQQFVDPVTRVNLTSVELEDPTVTPLGPWIDTDLLIVGVLMPSNRNLYWNKILMHFQLADGTIITTLDDGTPISYDPPTGTVLDSTTGVAISSTGAFLSLKKGKISIYDANGLQLRDQFLF